MINDKKDFDGKVDVSSLTFGFRTDKHKDYITVLIQYFKFIGEEKMIYTLKKFKFKSADLAAILLFW